MGSHIIQENFADLDLKDHDSTIAKTKNEVFELLRKTMRPEFLNRIDETVMFLPLNRSNIHEIVEIQFKQIAAMMLKNNDIELEATPQAIEWLSELGYDPQFGARPLKRVLQRRVMNELSKMILGGTVDKEKKIIIDTIDGQIIFRNE